MRGIDLAYDYCDKHNVPYKECGKLIIATDDVEVQRLRALFERAQENKCRNIELVDGKRIQEFEPNCVVSQSASLAWFPCRCRALSISLYEGMLHGNENNGETFRSSCVLSSSFLRRQKCIRMDCLEEKRFALGKNGDLVAAHGNRRLGTCNAVIWRDVRERRRAHPAQFSG